MNRYDHTCHRPKVPRDDLFSQIPAFDRLYDATDTYRRKSDMDQLSADQLELGDLVLAEVFIHRWIAKPETTDAEGETDALPAKKKPRTSRYGQGRPARREWKEWNVEFRLDALSLLYSGSQYYNVAIKPDEDVVL